MQDGQGSGSGEPERGNAWHSVPEEDDSPTPGETPSAPGTTPADQADQPAPWAAAAGSGGATGPAPQQPDEPGASWVPAPGSQPPAAGQPPAGGQPAPETPTWTQPPIWRSQPGISQPGTPHPGTPGGAPPGGPQPWPPLPAGQGTWAAPSGPQPWEHTQPAGSYQGPPLPAGGYGQPPGGGYAPPGGYGQPGGGYGTPGGYGPPPPAPKGSRFGRGLIYIVVAALAAALGAGAVLALNGRSSNTGSGSGTTAGDVPRIPTPGSAPPQGNNTSAINVQAVAGKVEPGVVDITSYVRYSGQVFEGTGMVLSASGLVLTNNHVVNGSTRLVVTLVSNGKRYQAQVVGTDAKDDVALLRLTGASNLKTIHVGNSSTVQLGTQVVALGNAGGTGGPPTVTSGAITALHRTITAGDAGSRTAETLHDMLQTNASIAEGDSGGPLANAAGQVIGMDTAANTQNLGGAGTAQGFAIPINRALALARQMAAGHPSANIHLGQPAFIGIAIPSTTANGPSPLTSPRQQLRQLQQVAQQAGGGVNSSQGCMTTNVGQPVPSRVAPVSAGALIAAVFCNAPAQMAGMKGGDVITSVDGQAVTSPSALTHIMLSHYHPGDTVSVGWVDTSGAHHTSSVTLAAGPAK